MQKQFSQMWALLREHQRLPGESYPAQGPFQRISLGPSWRCPAQPSSSRKTWKNGEMQLTLLSELSSVYGGWEMLASIPPSVQFKSKWLWNCYNNITDALTGACACKRAWLCLVSPSNGIYNFSLFVLTFCLKTYAIREQIILTFKIYITNSIWL